MKLIVRFTLSLLLLALPVLTIAQEFYQSDTTVKVYAYGKQLPLAWCGGFDNPEFAMADLNRDGKPDLVIFERGLGIGTFINTGTTAGIPNYSYAPKYALNFPPVRSYIYMKDYNCDGIADLFDRGDDGFGVYKGYYNAANQLCFTFYKSLFYYNDVTAGGPANAYVNPSDVPGIADVDGDGDLDFVSYYITGGYMYYHQNMRVEDGLPCDSIRIKLKDRCWGKVYQGFYREHSLGHSCSNAGLLRPAAPEEKKTHAGNTICLFDWDMDGDIDYLDGNVSFNEMTFLKNGKTEYGNPIDTMVTQDTLWQSGGKRIDLPTWPAAFNVDIDQDGKSDLLISPNASGSENYNCIWYYKNYSTPGTPDWRFQSDSFLVDKSIDLGTGSYPLLFDYDKDGRLDLLVGSDGYRQVDGQLKSRMSFYKNTSSSVGASFTLQTKDLISMSTHSFQGAAPAVGDIDGDGKSDLIVGHTNGTLSYFKNMAVSDAVQPDWQLVEVALQDDAATVINVDGNAAPFIYDIDKDGKLDLIIGDIYGYIRYYRNVATTPGNIKLRRINNRLGNAKADPTQNFGNYAAPFIGKVDPTGTEFLLMGSNSGNIYQYSGFQTGDTTATYTLVDGQYSFIDSTFNRYRNPSYGIYDGHRTTLTVGDIDGSGSYSLIKGNIRGGLEFYKRKVYVADLPVYAEEAQITVYPNPASNALNISWSGISDSELQVSIFDISGRLCLEKIAFGHYGLVQFATNNLAQGVYMCVLKGQSGRHYSKFTILR